MSDTKKLSITDNCQDEILVMLGTRRIRSWIYSGDSERQTKTRMAREYVEGWTQAELDAPARRMVFICPKYPDCGCPEGTIADGCPGESRLANGPGVDSDYFREQGKALQAEIQRHGWDAQN